MTSRLISVLILLGVVVIAARLLSRLRYGRCLMRIGEESSPTRPIVGAVVVVIYLLSPWVASHFAWARLIEWVAYLAALVVVFSAPPPAGSWTVSEKGILCAEGPKAEFVRWEYLDRFEWRGNIVVVHRLPALIGAGFEAHSLEVPIDRRSELEAILATRLQQRS